MVRAAALLAAAGAVLTRCNARALPVPTPPAAAVTQDVVVCVPARDEAALLPLLISDLRVQQDVPRLRVLVLDDGSTDGTAEVARAAAGDDPRVQVHTGAAAIPDGWLGKPHACQQLAELAWAQRPPDVLVFVDADVRLAPHAVGASVVLLRELGLGLLSPWPQQVAVSWAERLVQPVQQWSWLSTVPLAMAQRSSRPSFAAANGQLLVVDAAAYRAAGGHAGVAGQVVEDVALARLLRRAGHRTAPADGSQLARCRMYSSAAEVRAGYGKSLWTAFGSPAGAAAVLGALCLVHVLPAVAALLGTGRTRAWGLLGALASTDSRLVAARTAGTRTLPDSLAHPLSVLVVVALTLDSYRAHRRGTLRWKGRRLT